MDKARLFQWWSQYGKSPNLDVYFTTNNDPRYPEYGCLASSFFKNGNVFEVGETQMAAKT